MIAEDLVPEAVRIGKPVWVEGVGKQSQLYQTATVPVTIAGKQTEVLMVVTPMQHIPYAVVLGRNVPGLKLMWSLDVAAGKDTMVAGERASQVVQGSASILPNKSSQWRKSLMVNMVYNRTTNTAQRRRSHSRRWKGRRDTHICKAWRKGRW